MEEPVQATGVLLSICIPTFNRAALLKQTLDSIVCQAPFTDGRAIEVVISDNCSSDDTQAVVAPFVAAYPDQVRYFRHAEGIPADMNFETVLRHGRGAFLKLHNDNLLIHNGSLAEIVKVVAATEAEKPVLFFTNGNMNLGQPIEVLATLNDFVRRVSYFSTWIGGFGVWRAEFAVMTDFARCAKLQLLQTDVLLRRMAAGKRAIVLYDTYFQGQEVAKKGGYNIAQVFGHNYLSLLKQYLALGLLQDAVFQAEKHRLLLYHIIPYYFDKNNDFLKSGFFPYMQDYLHDDYFYKAIENLIDVMPARPPAPAPAAPPADPAEAYQIQAAEQWRALNAHNETILAHAYGRFDFNKVTCGRRSYGGLTVWTFGCGDEGLRIGHFVSIADEVKFLLGGNHRHDGVSTFPFMAKYFGTAESGSKGPIVIGDDVWVGYNSTILSGVTIGQGAVVAAGSMVNKDVPPYAIVGGNPARLIKYRHPPEVIARLARLDYARVSDQSILRNRELLSLPLTLDNVDLVIERLMDLPPG